MGVSARLAPSAMRRRRSIMLASPSIGAAFRDS
jgi:hypothetical protein